MGSTNSDIKTGCRSMPNNQIHHSQDFNFELDTKTGPSYCQKTNQKENTEYVESNTMCAQILQNNKKHREFRKNKRTNNNLSLVNLPPKSQFSQQRSQVEIFKLENPTSHNDYQSKLKYFENNKKIIEKSIEATICVERALNMLCHHSILQSTQFDYLNSKNKRSLECKQKRYKNLELRQHKVMVSMQGNSKENRQNKFKQPSNSVHQLNQSSIRQKNRCIGRPSFNIYKR